MTREKAILVLDSLSTWLGYERPITIEIVEAIKTLSQPSLPSDLDEAAFAYENSSEYPPANQEEERMVYDAFKAGAEWMAGQGVTEEYDVDEDGIFLDSDSLGVCLMAYPPSELGCKERDTLIIQMRKRKSGESLKEKEDESK